MRPRALPALFAVRKEIYSDAHDGSNLRMARPQEMMSDGASCIRRVSWIRGDACMALNGLAVIVGTWVRVFTTSSRPGITAEPPASRMWSTWLYEVEVNRNCGWR